MTPSDKCSFSVTTLIPFGFSFCDSALTRTAFLTVTDFTDIYVIKCLNDGWFPVQASNFINTHTDAELLTLTSESSWFYTLFFS